MLIRDLIKQLEGLKPEAELVAFEPSTEKLSIVQGMAKIQFKGLEESEVRVLLIGPMPEVVGEPWGGQG